MSMSRTFPRNGMRRGPGGSESVLDFVFDFQTDRATRETAAIAITVTSMICVRKHEPSDYGVGFMDLARAMRMSLSVGLTPTGTAPRSDAMNMSHSATQ